ncbi:hypothetical protein Tco_0999943 [Tanacetum coccineum]
MVLFSQTCLRTTRKTVRHQPPMAASIESLIDKFASVPTPPSPPPSPLSPLSSSLPGSHPHLFKLALPMLVHHWATEQPWIDIPEAEMPPRKRACFTAPTRRFEIGESLAAAAVRQARHALTVVEEVNERVTDLATTQGQDAHELYVHCEDAQDDRALMRAQISLLTREGKYFHSMASSYLREVVYARQAWNQSESMSQTMEAQIRALQRDVSMLQRQRINDGDRLTSHIQHEHDRFKELARTREKMPPKKTTTTPMTDAAIKALIAQGVVDALSEYEA